MKSTHPRSACGASPSRGRHQWPGKAGSTVLLAVSGAAFAQATPGGTWCRLDGKEVWEGGRILDPENGREYTLRMTPVDGGGKLDVRGSFGPFGRTQTWVRVQP